MALEWLSKTFWPNLWTLFFLHVVLHPRFHSGSYKRDLFGLLRIGPHNLFFFLFFFLKVKCIEREIHYFKVCF